MEYTCYQQRQTQPLVFFGAIIFLTPTQHVREDNKGVYVWDPKAVVLQEKLERVPKRSARFITGNNNWEYDWYIWTNKMSKGGNSI